jgi:multidrug efflux pump subunit AcrA (membrane-fusion protein)
MAVGLLSGRLFHGSEVMAASGPDKPADAKGPPNTVTMPEGKLKAAGITIAEAREEALPVEVAVTGTIEPDPYKRVDVRSRAVGVVRAIKVLPSQKVKAGDVLAILDSADVGKARLHVRTSQNDLALARRELDWRATIAANVEQLIPVLDRNIAEKLHEEHHTLRGPQALAEMARDSITAEIERQFGNKPLGTRRAELISSYAELTLAAHEAAKQRQLLGKEIIGEHPAFAAMYGRESALAKFKATAEQVRFDAQQQKRVAEQQVRMAEAALIDAVDRLQMLGVKEGPDDPLDIGKDIDPKALAKEDVTNYPILAPFDGTILTVSYVTGQMVETTDVLVTLADLTDVHVAASIPEVELADLPDLEGGTVRMTAAAYPGRTFEAKVLYTGALVDPMTRRVQLVAETSNVDNLLRLGMFVRVVLDSRRATKAMTVPEAAVVSIDGRTGVFRPHPDGRTFGFHPVTVGMASQGRQVIKEGLAPGDRVVGTGVFMLKSELVLQNEPEEE